MWCGKEIFYKLAEQREKSANPIRHKDIQKSVYIETKKKNNTQRRTHMCASISTKHLCLLQNDLEQWTEENKAKMEKNWQFSVLVCSRAQMLVSCCVGALKTATNLTKQRFSVFHFLYGKCTPINTDAPNGFHYESNYPLHKCILSIQIDENRSILELYHFLYGILLSH